MTLLWGEDAFLLRETALQLLGDLRATEVDAGEWQGGELQDLATPSLFGEPRALLVTDCRSLPKDAMVELAAYLSAPDPDAPLVLACTTAERGKPPAALVKIVEPVGQVRQVQIQRKELEPWLVQRAKAAGLDLTPPAARVLVETLGEDIGQLAAALEQLQGAFQGAAGHADADPPAVPRSGRTEELGSLRPGVRQGSARCDPVASLDRGGRRRRVDGAGGDRRAAPRPHARARVA